MNPERLFFNEHSLMIAFMYRTFFFFTFKPECLALPRTAHASYLESIVCILVMKCLVDVSGLD